MKASTMRCLCYMALCLLLLAAFPEAGRAQRNDQTLPDTLQYLDGPPPEVISDTVIAAPGSADENDIYNSIEDSVAEPNSPYVLRGSQVSGGGPDSIAALKFGKAELQKLRDDDDFWYANYSFDKVEAPKPVKKSFTNSSWFNNLIWFIIVGVFIAVLLVYLVNSNVRLLRRSRTIKQVEEDAEEPATEDIFAINYSREIDRAVAAGNFRLAVRLQFLRLLRNLSQKKLIDYKQDRTNFDYLMQLNRSNWYADFFRLTRNYEYSWYGQFQLDAQQYGSIKNDFENFDRKLG